MANICQAQPRATPAARRYYGRALVSHAQAYTAASPEATRTSAHRTEGHVPAEPEHQARYRDATEGSRPDTASERRLLCTQQHAPMVLIRNHKLHPTRNDVEWQGPRTKAPKTWGPDYHGPKGPAKRPRINGSYTPGEPMRPWRGSGESRVRPPWTRPLRPANYVRPANRLFNALKRARAVAAAVRAAAGVAAGGAAAPIVAGATIGAGVGIGLNKARAKFTEIRKARRHKYLMSRRVPPRETRPRPPDNWGNQDDDEPPAKKPVPPGHHHEGWMLPDDDFGPDDHELPEYRDIPGPGNPGTHNTHALRNGDSTSSTRSAARFRSSSVRVTSPSHIGQLPLRDARGCPRSARFQRSTVVLAFQTRYAQRRAVPALSAAPQASCASTAHRCPWAPA